MDICDSTIVFMTKCDIPGRLRVKTTITHQVESPLSEKNIDPCFYLSFTKSLTINIPSLIKIETLRITWQIIPSKWFQFKLICKISKVLSLNLFRA